MEGRSGVGSAPGRLDVMGGVGDYSGCHVLEAPIDQATTCTLRCASGAPAFVMRSKGWGYFEIPFNALQAEDSAWCTPAQARVALDELGAPAWARYVAGTRDSWHHAHL